MGIILSAQNICKTYFAASGEVHALSGVSADFEAGLFYAIIGRSGSGKSTLLHILSGLDAPTSGKVILNGEDLPPPEYGLCVPAVQSAGRVHGAQ